MKSKLLQKKAEFLCRIVVAIIFLWAGVPKLLDPVSFAKIIEAYGIVPDSLLLPSAILISSGEVLFAVGLMFKSKASLAGITLLLVVFVAVLTYGIVFGLDIDCGCFGPEEPEFQAFSGLKSALLRDVIIGVPVGYLWYTLLFQSKKKRKEIVA